MDEYFCPNCDAILNEQSGFDPSRGTWTCTSCGKLLMDDNIYNGDTFEGVAWFCDDCGALLNRQSGFSDTFGSWICTECGYQNSISEDDILDESTSDLDGLSALFAGVTGIVIGLGINKLLQKIEQKQQKEAEAERIRLQQEKERKARNALRRKQAAAFLFRGKKIKIRYGFEDLIGRNIEFVTRVLTESAFTNIKTIPSKDIYTHSSYNIGQVEQVIINGSGYFREGDHIPYDANIIVTYHEKGEIQIPFTERSLRKMNYAAVRDMFQELGFTEIYGQPIRDLVTGWINKEGSVKSVTVGEVYPFKKNSIFTYDTKIVIEYHTFT